MLIGDWYGGLLEEYTKSPWERECREVGQVHARCLEPMSGYPSDVSFLFVGLLGGLSLCKWFFVFPFSF